MNHLKQRLFLLAFLLFVAGVSPVLAASGVDVIDREREQTRPQPQARPRMQVLEDGKAAPELQERSVLLRSLQVSGATAFGQNELLAPYRSLIGSRVPFARIQGIAAELTKKYRDAGFLLSRVIVPAQEIDEDGADVRLAVVEGYIESVQYSGDDRVLERFKRYFASAEADLLGQRPLNHRVFERHMLLMQDVPGLEVTSRFEQGSAQGASVLHIEVQQDTLDGNLNWGNTGTDESGPGMFGASLSLNTLPLLGNQTTVSYTQANDYREYWSFRVAESYQFSNGFSLNASWMYSESPRMDSDFARTFDYETSSSTLNLGMSYPIIRSRDMNLSAGLGYEHRNSEADLEDRRLTKDRLRSLNLHANFDYADALGGVTQIIPTLSHGLNIFDASDHSDEATNTLAPADYWKFDLYISRNQSLPKDFSVLAAAELQLASDSLASYNKFSFGGSNFGRGYEPGVLEADNAFALFLEPRWTWHLAERTSLQFFAFIDYGVLWTSESVAGTPDRLEGASAGGGFRFWGHFGPQAVPDFNLSAYVGQPLIVADEKDGRETRFVVQVGLSF